ncbi:MAG: FKBP-type peptidyl-prolyl cis-trans isomerase [Bacteroidales bacterium]
MCIKFQAYKERNQKFLAEYSNREGVQQLSSGVMYRVITRGKGEIPTANSVVMVHYKGTLINGKVFDSTFNAGRPEKFRLSQLIEGWKIALTQMPVGSHWEIVVPYNVGYGTRSAGDIKAYSTLIFEIQLLGIA